MAKISLLEFFRTGTFGGVEVGMSRQEVESQLGTPQHFIEGSYCAPGQYEKAGIWIYGGVELIFAFSYETYENTDVLDAIYFKTIYFTGRERRRRNKVVDTWIFGRSSFGLTKHQLEAGLQAEAIQFQDTGLQMLVNVPGTHEYEMIDYDEFRLGQMGETDEFVGTLVLKSGVEVRYDEKDVISKISKPGKWLYKGRESLIQW
jgi:hypothetical protein